MTTRRAIFDDLPGLLRLYRFLNPADPVIDPQDEAASQHWRRIVRDPCLRYYVVELPSGGLISTCTLALVPNLTRSLRPYGVMENVVTDPEHRGQGHATRLLRHALNDAWREGCYKVMLSTGSKRESTLQFYEKAGFRRGVKTGFVAYPDQLPPTIHQSS